MESFPQALGARQAGCHRSSTSFPEVLLRLGLSP